MSSSPLPSPSDSQNEATSSKRDLSDSELSLVAPSSPHLSASDPSLLAPSPIPESPSPSPHQSPSTLSFTSLPDSASSDTISLSPSSSSEASTSDAEREWKESLQQLELLLTMVVVPYLGKYFGRRCAYWGWAKYMEWKYPVHIEITNKTSFKVAGAVEAAATL